MLLEFDTESKALYINLKDDQNFKVHHTKEIEQEVFVDYDQNNKVLGIELLNPGFYSFNFVANIADKFNLPQLRQITHPEKLQEVISK